MLLRAHVCRNSPPPCLHSSRGILGQRQSLSIVITQVVGFVPTGWMYEMKRSMFPTRSKGPCTVHLVPYSEHSSYEELREYVRFLKPHQVRLRTSLGT